MKQLKLVYALVFISLFLTAMVPQVAAEPAIESELEMIWSTELNVTVYLPNTVSPLVSLSSEGVPTPISLQNLQTELSRNAMRPVNVRYDGERGLIAVDMHLYWSTSRDAVLIDEYRANPDKYGDNSVGLGFLATSNDSTSIVDAIPDDEGVETDVARSPTDVAGSENRYYRNTTDLTAASATVLDITDYNHSLYQFIDFQEIQRIDAGNMTIQVQYGNSTAVTENVTVHTSDWFMGTNDLFWKLPMPTSASATLVKGFVFTNLKYSAFDIYSVQADYDPLSEDYTFDQTSAATGLQPKALWNGFAKAVTGAVAKIPVAKDVVDQAQRGVGFTSIRDSLVDSAARSLGVPKGSIVDHALHGAADTITAPAALASNIYGSAKKLYEAGSKSPDALVKEARRQLKSVTLTTGLRAAGFGKAADTVDELSGPIISGIMEKGEKAVSSIGAWGSSVLDKAKDSLGRLPDKAASLFAKYNPLNAVKGLWDQYKWVIVAVVVIVALFALSYIVRTFK